MGGGGKGYVGPPPPKLDYQVSICSLIPPATAISKTQEPIKHTNEYMQIILTENC